MYDIIILATKLDVPILKISIPLIWENLKPKKIFVVANIREKREIIKLNVNYVDEKNVLNGLSLETIQNIIEKICGVREHAGWYLQQFIKMTWSYKTEDLFYVVLDADTIPLHGIEYINKEGKYYFTEKKEYHQPYFDSINRLFYGKIKKLVDFSFIAENMIFDTGVMREMIRDIEKNDILCGNMFYEKILYSINIEDILKSGFSEFETYGNYISEKYPEKVAYRKLRTLREAVQLLGGNPNREKLKWAARDYDIISIESSVYRKTLMTRFTSVSAVRKMFRLRWLVIIRTKLRTFYRKLIHKTDRVFD